MGVIRSKILAFRTLEIEPLELIFDRHGFQFVGFTKDWSRSETVTIDYTLQAINGSIIQTYGKGVFSLNLGLCGILS